MRRCQLLRMLLVGLTPDIQSVLAFRGCPRGMTCLDSRGHSLYRQGPASISALTLFAANNDNEQDIVPPSSSDEDKIWHSDLRQRHDEIQVVKTRTSLEQQHTQSFLKKRPIKLPYDVARRWVRDNLGVSTKEEFEDFVAMGYIQTPYIPKNPEQYYTRTREWISWDHFLNDLVAIQPLRGAFD